MVIKYTRRDKIFTIFNYTLGTLFMLSVLYPLIYVLSASFSDPVAVTNGDVKLLPVNPTLMGYKAVFAQKEVLTGYMNSIYYMVVGSFCSVMVTIFAAYPLSRKDFPGRGIFTFIFTFTMIFGGGMIPTFLLVRSLGLIDTRAAMILPCLMGVWNVIVARTYFSGSIPGELLDAAHIDGASDFRFFFQIVIPLSGPIIAVLALFYAVGYWNSFFSALLYLNDPELYPLQMVLRNILINSEAQQNDLIMDVEEMLKREGLKNLLKYSLIVVASLPVMLIYPFVQKHFVKGVMIGSLKG